MKTAIKYTMAGVALVLISACGTTGSVQKMGPDTFKVSASKHNMSGGAPSAETDALDKANQHCQMLGKEVLVSNTSKSFERPFYNFSATFLCLSKNDKRLTAPSYEKSPDVIIERRNR